MRRLWQSGTRTSSLPSFNKEDCISQREGISVESEQSETVQVNSVFKLLNYINSVQRLQGFGQFLALENFLPNSKASQKLCTNSCTISKSANAPPGIWRPNTRINSGKACRRRRGEHFNIEGRVRNVHLLFHNYTIVPQNAQNAKYYKVEHSKNTDEKWNNKMATLNDPHMCFRWGLRIYLNKIHKNWSRHFAHCSPFSLPLGTCKMSTHITC